MQHITPFLWFDHQAKEAAEFYVTVFQRSGMGAVTLYPEGSPGPAGTVMTASFTLCGRAFTALNGGPLFTFTPAVSFSVNCETKEELQAVWDKLSPGGSVMMKLTSYPFSEYYGWLTDKYGVSWQLNLTKRPQDIIPCLMFAGEVCGQAGEAIAFYTSLFSDSTIDVVVPYDESDPNVTGTVKFAAFRLCGQPFHAMDSGVEHGFSFSLATSFVAHCDTQEEIDRLWTALSADPAAEQCGWLKDRYGLSWQIVPAGMDTLMGGDAARAKRVMQAMLPMKKLDIAALQTAALG